MLTDRIQRMTTTNNNLAINLQDQCEKEVAEVKQRTKEKVTFYSQARNKKQPM